MRQTARRFAEERILPLIRDCYRDARFPTELIPEMAELGFLGANLEGYGCAGMSNVEYGLIMQELERVDSGVRSFVSVQGALVMYPIYTYGSDEQKQTLAAGAAERQGGRVLRPDGAGFRLEPGGHAHHRAARRRWLGAQRREDVDHQRNHGRCGGRLGARRRGHPSASWWSAGRRASTTSDIHGKWSMRASVTSSLSFADCRVTETRPAAGREGLERAALLPLAGALRHRVGRDRRGHGLLRDGAPVLHPAQAVRRPARSLRTNWCRKSWPG